MHADAAATSSSIGLCIVCTVAHTQAALPHTACSWLVCGKLRMLRVLPARTAHHGMHIPGKLSICRRNFAWKLDDVPGCGRQVRRRERLTWRLRVDSSSLMPPERKWMPGTAGGMLRSIVRTVNLATSCGGGVGTSRPGRHMLGFSSIPSIRMPYSFSSRNTWL